MAVASTGAPAGEADLKLDDDALVRLVYGRLDPEHSPVGADGPKLDTLRQVFPGPYTSSRFGRRRWPPGHPCGVRRVRWSAVTDAPTAR